MHPKGSSKAPGSAGTLSTVAGGALALESGQIPALDRSVAITQPSPHYIDVKTKAWREETQGAWEVLKAWDAS